MNPTGDNDPLMEDEEVDEEDEEDIGSESEEEEDEFDDELAASMLDLDILDEGFHLSQLGMTRQFPNGQKGLSRRYRERIQHAKNAENDSDDDDDEEYGEEDDDEELEEEEEEEEMMMMMMTGKEVCSVCEKGCEKQSLLIMCKACDKCVHLQCCGLPYTTYDAIVENWYCSECIRCSICSRENEEEGGEGNNVFYRCSMCGVASHQRCLSRHQEKLKKYSPKWLCSSCTVVPEAKKQASIASYIERTPPKTRLDTNATERSPSSPLSSASADVASSPLTQVAPIQPQTQQRQVQSQPQPQPHIQPQKQLQLQKQQIIQQKVSTFHVTLFTLSKVFMLETNFQVAGHITLDRLIAHIWSQISTHLPHYELEDLYLVEKDFNNDEALMIVGQASFNWLLEQHREVNKICGTVKWRKST